MSYNLIIEEFDSNITGYVDQLKEKIKDITFDSSLSIPFIISDQLDSKILFNEKKQGVYLFELNLESGSLTGMKKSTQIKNFAEDWTKKKNNSFFSSSIIKKRLLHRKDYNEQWLPLYIGKSKDLHKRIREHIELSPLKNTYAMKLKHRANLHGLEFRVSTIELDVKNYDFIVPYVERTLREEYHPLIGRQ